MSTTASGPIIPDQMLAADDVALLRASFTTPEGLLMRWLSRLHQRLEPYAVPHIPLYLVVGQGLLYGVSLSDPGFSEMLALIPQNFLDGEYWRVFSFVLMPPVTHPVFLFFTLYFLHLSGTALEHYWGALRFNVFLLIGYAATVGVAFAFPQLRHTAHTNAFIGSSIFLAFAKLYPNYQMSLYFIIPIRIYWLALFTWFWIITSLLTANSWAQRCYILAGILNYMLFFRTEIVRGATHKERSMRRQIAHIKNSYDGPFRHQCVVCGLTDSDDPDMEFRYCSRCEGTPCYCSEHLQAHQHIEPKSEGS